MTMVTCQIPDALGKQRVRLQLYTWTGGVRALRFDRAFNTGLKLKELTDEAREALKLQDLATAGTELRIFEAGTCIYPLAGGNTVVLKKLAPIRPIRPINVKKAADRMQA